MQTSIGPWKFFHAIKRLSHARPTEACVPVKPSRCSYRNNLNVYARAAPKPAVVDLDLFERDVEKEKSRAYRRTHFDHADWARHRCTSRYWRHLQSGIITSRIVRGLAGPLWYVGITSLAVCSYEQSLAHGVLQDLWGVHWLSLSLSIVGPFSLSTFALSLLLVFRTNGSYQRWNEARKFWGLCTNRSRDIARQALLWMPADSDAALLAAMLRWTAAFPLALMVSLREDHTLREALQDALLPAELELLIAQSHPGTACLQAMGACVAASHATPIQKMRIDENITIMQDVMGGCERIFRTPIPLSYTRHTSRFLVCWLTLLPFCVADAFGWATIPISIGMAFFLFGIEEIGVQIEEPFGILPLELYCENICKNIRQAGALSTALRSTTEAAVTEQTAARAVGTGAAGSSSTTTSASRLTRDDFNHAVVAATSGSKNGSRGSSSPVANRRPGKFSRQQLMTMCGSAVNAQILTSEEDLYQAGSVVPGEADEDNFLL